MGGSIPFACQDWANTKAAYRFFSNPNVEEGDILNGHFAATAQRYDASQGPILVLRDTTEFTYQRRNPHAVGFTKSVNSGRDKQERLRLHGLRNIDAFEPCCNFGWATLGVGGRQILEPRQVQGHGPAQAQD